MAEAAIVYISRRYADPWDVSQTWPRERRLPEEPEWYATTGGTPEPDAEAEFDSVEAAIAW